MKLTHILFATLATLGHAKPCGRPTTATSSTADACLAALESQGNLAVASCQLALWTSTIVTTTVTESPATTVVEEETATVVVTVLTTDTVTTGTSLFTITDTTTTVVTEPTTVTSTPISTEIQTILEQTTTTTVFTYPAPPSARALNARATSAIPDYAASECLVWSAYESACGRLGITTSTSTIRTTTVTETAPTTDTSLETSTVATLTLTSDQVETATATTSTTQVVSESTTLTTTDTIVSTVATTTTVTTTVLSAVAATNTCGAANTSFRLRTLYSPDVPDTYWLNVPGSDTTRIAELSVLGDPVPDSARDIASWTIPGPGTDLGAAGALQLAEVLPGDTEVYVACYQLPVDGGELMASVPIVMATRSVVDSGVAAGVLRRVSACISTMFGGLYVYDVDDKTNFLKCDEYLFLSSGDGSDTGLTCTRINLNIDTR